MRFPHSAQADAARRRCSARRSPRSSRRRSRPAGGAAETGGAGQVESGGNVSNSAFDRQGMWVWYVSRSEGGSVAAIIARAKRNDVGTVYIKAGDGGGAWSQFSSGLVQALHRGGLSVCAWQFVYGDSPARRGQGRGRGGRRRAPTAS